MHPPALVDLPHNTQSTSPTEYRQLGQMDDTIVNVEQSSVPKGLETTSEHTVLPDGNTTSVETQVLKGHSISAPLTSPRGSNKRPIEGSGEVTSVNNGVASSQIATIPLTMNSLRKLAPELRQRILHMSGVSKATLAALIGDAVIYQEALKVYWDTVRCDIPHDVKAHRRWRFPEDCALSQKSLNSMRKVTIHYQDTRWRSLFDSPTPDPMDDFLHWGGWESYNPPMKELVRLNIPDLRLAFSLRTELTTPGTFQYSRGKVVHMNAMRVARDCVAAFLGTSPGLLVVSCEFTPAEMEYLERWNFDCVIDHLNMAFGLAAKLRSVNNGTGLTVYFWSDPEGKQLTWRDIRPKTYPFYWYSETFQLGSSPYLQK